MKITVVTDAKGAILGASYGHVPEPDPGTVSQVGFRAGLIAGPDQKIQVLDVKEDILRIDSPKEFHKRLESEMRSSTSKSSARSR